MSYRIVVPVEGSGGFINGVSVDAWEVSRFANANVPAKDSAPPSGSPDAGPVTTATNGAPGQAVLDVPAGFTYNVRVQQGGHSYWTQTSEALGVKTFQGRTAAAATMTKADVTGTGLTYSDVGADASGAAAAVQATLTASIAAKAPLASPALTDSPTAPTQTAGDNSTKIATTAYADGAVATEVTNRTTAVALKAPGNLSAYAATAAAAGRYDPTANIYNANNSNLLAFRTAFANAVAGTGACRIAIGPGDSTYAGVTAGGGTDVRGTGDIATLLNAYLNNRAGISSPGSGFMPGGSVQPDVRVARVGFTNRAVYTPSVAAGNTVTFTPGAGQVGTAVRLYYVGTSAAFTWTIDGNAQTAPSVAHGATVQCMEVTGLSNTAHVVAVTASASNVFIMGCEVGSPSTSGISVSNFAVSGSGSTSGSGSGWKDISTNYSYIWPLLKMGQALDGTSGQASKPLPFHLITIGLLINDWNTGIDPATYKSTLATIISTLQALSPAPSILLTVPAQAYNGSSPATYPTYQWSQYVQALYQLADTYNLPLLDFGDRWSAPGNTDVQNWNLANGQGLMTTSNSFHPSALGYRDQASALLGLLSPTPPSGDLLVPSTATGTTQSAGDNSTKIATTAYADAAVATEVTNRTTADGLRVLKAGDTMSGALAMGSNKITGLANGTATTDAAALGQLPSVPTSANQGLLAATFADMAGATGTITLTAGVQYFFMVNVTAPITATKFTFRSVAAASGLTHGFLGLYTQAGALISGSTTADTTAFTAATTYSISLGTPQTLAAGIYYVGIMFSGTTPPTLIGVNAGGLLIGPTTSSGTLAGGNRALTNGTGLTALLSSVSGTPALVNTLVAVGIV